LARSRSPGVGGAGAIPVGPLFAQAIEDALDLHVRRIEILEIPLSSGQPWQLLAQAK
jgi:aerobic carbon-monoxide dehydrogenase large subunit